MAKVCVPGDGDDEPTVEGRLKAARDRKFAAIRETAGKRLEEFRSTRAPEPVDMQEEPKKRPRKSKRFKRRGGKSIRHSEAADQQMVDQLVTSEAKRHGDYRAVDFKIEDTGNRDKAKEKSIRVVRNLGTTQVERWHAKHIFDERQMAAILFYQDAHRKVFGSGPSVTASYSPVILRGLRESVELWAGSKIAAREILRLLDQEVFLRDFDRFCVWQNVVIFDQAAGIAGGLLGYRSAKQAEAVAREVVKMLACQVADIVIDSSRKDFGDLLLDIDAPRKPGSKAA